MKNKVEQVIAQYINCERLSDIHIHADGCVALRIDGELSIQHNDSVNEEHLINFSERYLKRTQKSAQKDSVDFRISICGRHLRANFYRQRARLALALRVLPAREPRPEDISLPPAVFPLLERHGLVLVSGATGSGKSTTLSAMTHYIYTHKQVHILTIEDPIEYPLESKDSLISRREIGSDATSFVDALRSGLRQDPDIILIGELRDAETAMLALTAAETGHLVLSTLHAPNCVQAISRLIGMFPPDSQASARIQLAQSLRLILSQRLFRRSQKTGRVAAFEILKVNLAVSSLIRENNIFQILSVMQTAYSEGMATMDAAIERLQKEGLIDQGGSA